MSEDMAALAVRWWRTSIIDIHPGVIRLRGYAIEDLIGRISFPQTIWLMLRGNLPTAEEAALLEAALVAAVDHGPQAPSIAVARMAITAGNDINHAMGAAITLLGDVHGGAGQQCMSLFQDVARRCDNGVSIEAATECAIADYRQSNGRYIPGYGHRFHPIDPRAPRLLQLVSAAAKQGVVSGRYAAIGCAIESRLSSGRRQIPMNIDGASAVVFSELGFEPELGRGLFVMSRAVGILAHAWEQRGQCERIKGPMPPQVPYTYDGEPPRQL
jgi:citrate synthase